MGENTRCDVGLLSLCCVNTANVSITMEMEPIKLLTQSGFWLRVEKCETRCEIRGENGKRTGGNNRWQNASVPLVNETWKKQTLMYLFKIIRCYRTNEPSTF